MRLTGGHMYRVKDNEALRIYWHLSLYDAQQRCVGMSDYLMSWVEPRYLNGQHDGMVQEFHKRWYE